MTQVSDIIRDSVLSGDLRWADRHLAEDGVFEFPFAAPGRAKRYEGRAAFLAMAGPARAALPFTFDLRIRDGKVVLWHGYQDTFAVLQAMAQP